MLLQPRTYQLAQTPDNGQERAGDQSPFLRLLHSHKELAEAYRTYKSMLLVHQTGSVKIGEVLRYTLTYTPGDDRILPSPPALFVKIKNTRAIPLRAAYLRGPYNLYCAAYPSTFDPYTKDVADDQKYGVPQFEPYLKPGAEWVAKLTVPEDIRETAETFARSSTSNDGKKSVTWVIEVVSQILFSLSSSVSFELLVSRDERSLELGKIAVAGGYAKSMGESAMDHQAPRSSIEGRSQKGIYSKAVKLSIADTASLWDRPALPEWEGQHPNKRRQSQSSVRRSMSHKIEPPKVVKQKKIHLVVLTHGIHSNVGADMLYVKESIDATVKQARENKKKRKREGVTKPAAQTQKIGSDRPKTATQDFAAKDERKESVAANGFWDGDGDGSSSDEPDKADADGAKLETVLSEDAMTSEPESLHGDGHGEGTTAALTGGQDELDPDDDDEEEVVVRGFSGNVTHTEKGIQYLGKRLAKSLLEMTYPDQPYRAAKKTRKFSTPFGSTSSKDSKDAAIAHAHSSVYRPEEKSVPERAYKYTSISFVGHSLGGLVQLYAIGYIQKHSPEFFDLIKPVNFVGMASPFLGLSNENPVYVKFALDFGLVGRTGQDLGLTWRPPTLAKGLWDVVFQTDDKKKGEQPDPGAKPLLRILPSGPAHQALKKFKNRTVYSNIVNDGIVPLRTSCLLFLDWRGLEKIDKARRENGLIGTVANWGWQEMTGANSSPHPRANAVSDNEVDGADTPPRSKHSDRGHKGSIVPQPAEDTTNVDDEVHTAAPTISKPSFEEDSRRHVEVGTSEQRGTLIDDADPPRPTNPSRTPQSSGPMEAFLNFFRQAGSGQSGPKQQSVPKPPPSAPKPQAKPVPKLSKKDSRMFKRSQTLKPSEWDPMPQGSDIRAARLSGEGHIPNREEGEHGAEAHIDPPGTGRPAIARGDSMHEDASAPPKTSIFESAGDLIAPPIPSQKWINDPGSRAKVIIHDRLYHPSDIPPPPSRKDVRTDRFFTSHGDIRGPADQPSHKGAGSMDSTLTDTSAETDVGQPGSMRVEEKIARAYHHDLSWRKVLVKLEPDAHNNMVVRRMFANAYGWPVVKHLCDTHFAE